MSDDGFVYLIGEAPDWAKVKVGWSKNPERRLNMLQTGNPRRLRLLMKEPAGPAGEARLHEAFADARLRGEWFDRFEMERIADRLKAEYEATATEGRV